MTLELRYISKAYCITHEAAPSLGYTVVLVQEHLIFDMSLYRRTCYPHQHYQMNITNSLLVFELLID